MRKIFIIGVNREMDNPLKVSKEAASENSQVSWDKDAKIKFDLLIEKVPVFLKDMAQSKVLQKTENIVRKDNRNLINEKDLVDAFFAATPFGFHGPMKTDMMSIGLDYTKYGYSK